MPSSNRPSGPGRPQNEQRDAAAEQEGLDELAAQQAPVDDGALADADDFAVADALGDVPPDGKDDARRPSAPEAGRQAGDAERDAHAHDDSGNQPSRP